MEGQALPRLQPLSMHHLNKGRHQNSNMVSPPLSPTSTTAPRPPAVATPSAKPAPNLPPNPKATPKQPTELQKRGWTSFDDSPVHSQPPGNNFQAGQSPWAGGHPDGKQWTPFNEKSAKADAETPRAIVKPQVTQPPTQLVNTPANAAPTQHANRARGAVTSTPVKPPQPPVAYPTPGKQPHPMIPKPNLSEASLATNQVNSATYQTPEVSARRRVASKDSDGVIQPESHEGGTDFQDPWCITVEQREYYTRQFATMQSDLEGKINGHSARNFFTKSKLPILELSHIWELSDMDQDGHLTLDEFCTAFHLVVARKNGYDLPTQLPQALVPTLIDISGDAEKNLQDPFAPDAQLQEKSEAPPTQGSDLKKQEQWETFSDRTSSSTTLANFDQGPDSTTDHLHHPVPVRVTPSRHHDNWSQLENQGNSEKSKEETLDEESTTSSPQTRSKVVTNPYGFLRNEPDSGADDRELKTSSSDSTTQNAPSDDKPFRNRRIRARSRSNSSVSSTTSSVATSDRTSDDDSFKPNQDRSDIEHSDWSSRPLRPRSGSSSSMESGSVPPATAPPATAPPNPTTAAPTPPPRPQVHPQHTASPIPKPRPTISATKSNESKDAKLIVKDAERRLDGPTPPPRPHPTTNSKSEKDVKQTQESFADFSNFNKAPEAKASQVEKSKEVEAKVEKVKAKAPKEPTEKPVPAPRPQKEATKAAETPESESKDPDADKLHCKKAPVKPPRSRVLSSDVCKPEPIVNTLTIRSNEEPTIAPAPKQGSNRNKSELQSTIRELKNRNTQLTRLNGDLQQQLKDVMQTRITVEMTIHQMRPFTQ